MDKMWMVGAKSCNHQQRKRTECHLGSLCSIHLYSDKHMNFLPVNSPGQVFPIRGQAIPVQTLSLFL